MKKKMSLLVMLLFVLLLSGCEDNKYTITNDSLNGHDIYLYDSGQEICAAWYSMGVEVEEGTHFYRI